MANEKLLEKKLREQVKKLGGWAIKFWVINLAGFPDRIVLMPLGRIWFVEMKSSGKTSTRIQLLMHGKLRSLGFTVLEIGSPEALEDFINILKND